MSLTGNAPQLELAGLEDVVASFLFAPSLWWVVGAAAFGLWLLGNGLVLRLGKDNNA